MSDLHKPKAFSLGQRLSRGNTNELYRSFYSLLGKRMSRHAQTLKNILSISGHAHFKFGQQEYHGSEFIVKVCSENQLTVESSVWWELYDMLGMSKDTAKEIIRIARNVECEVDIASEYTTISVVGDSQYPHNAASRVSKSFVSMLMQKAVKFGADEYEENETLKCMVDDKMVVFNFEHSGVVVQDIILAMEGMYFNNGVRTNISDLTVTIFRIVDV